jgi:hypothetical protein
MAKRVKARKKQIEQVQPFDWVPLWGWVLVFLVPLALSEYMFYVADRTVSMVIFPLAWIGFWYVMMRRSGWPILKKNDKE